MRCSRFAALPATLALLGAGCGVGLTRELTAMDGGPMDGPPDGKTCMPNQAFRAPTLVPGLSSESSSVLSIRFSPDELTAYLSMFHGPQKDIDTAPRARRSDPLGGPVPIAALNTNDDEEDPTVTADGFTLYLARTSSSGASDLYVSTRTSTATTFSDPARIDELHANGENAPYVIPDGSALYFQTLRNGDLDIYRAQKNAIGFDPPESVAINTGADESAPVVSPDELTIFFFRHGDPGGGPDGVWTASRTSLGKSFENPVPLAGLNTPYRATPLWVSPDGCRLYLQEQDPQLGFAAYVAERVPLATP